MKMYYRKQNCIVSVYDFYYESHAMALIYSPEIAGKQNGNGWVKVRVKDLIPMEYFDGKNGVQSKSYRTRIKERLTLVSATWRASDGTEFSDCNDAVEYEKKLYEKEKSCENNEEVGMKYYIDLVVSQYEDEDDAFEGGNPTTFQERHVVEGYLEDAKAEFNDCFAEVLYEGDDIVRHDYILKDEDGNVLETTEGSSIE